MTSKNEMDSLLRLIQTAPESRILDWEFKAKERINLRHLESNGLIRILNYGSKIYWTITPKGMEAINAE